MKRQVLICVFLSLILILLVVAFIKMRNEDKLPRNETEFSHILAETETEEAKEISQDAINYKYYVEEDEGRLTVYETTTKNIYMETAIEVYHLPELIRINLQNGIYFETEEELYDFLESYSS